jgi:hypothetical protein
MDKDCRELIQRLFAVATMIASEMEEIGIAGQSPRLSDARYRGAAGDLLKRLDQLASVAETIIVVSNLR